MTRLCATVVCFLALTSISANSQTKAPATPAPSAASAANAAPSPAELRREFQQKIEHLYYKPSEHGFHGFRCSATPDWDELYKNVRVDAYLMESLKPALKQTQFQVVLGEDGASAVSHQLGEPPRSLEVAERLRTTVDGLDNILAGALQSWAALSTHSMLPAPGDDNYEIERSDGKYRLRRRGEDSEERMVVDASGRIERVEESNARFSIVLLPRWEETAEGLILSGYEADITSEGASMEKMRVGFAYMELRGQRLPQLVTLWMETPQGVLSGPISFSNYKFDDH